jgi:hypothetical protein
MVYGTVNIILAIVSNLIIANHIIERPLIVNFVNIMLLIPSGLYFRVYGYNIASTEELIKNGIRLAMALFVFPVFIYVNHYIMKE